MVDMARRAGGAKEGEGREGEEELQEEEEEEGKHKRVPWGHRHSTAQSLERDEGEEGGKREEREHQKGRPLDHVRRKRASWENRPQE